MPYNKYSPSTINDLLRSSPGSLSKIQARIARISYFQNKLRSELRAPLSEHLNVANFSDDTLVLHTDNPAWASRLRFNIRTILRIARNKCGLAGLKSVRIKVVIPNIDSKTNKRSLLLSENTAKMIGETTASINDHKLRTSLSNLSKHRNLKQVD